MALTLRTGGRPDSYPRDRRAPSSCPPRPWPSGWCGRSAKIHDGQVSPIGCRPREPLLSEPGLTGVLAVLYLIFNEGYLASDPAKEAVRGDLTAEAIRLTRLVRDLMPGDGEAAGLLALMLLTDARRAARVSASGELVTLGEQDRGEWDRELIDEGHALVRARLASGQAPGRYQILAAVNAVHTDARDARDTDWSQVIALYDQLLRLDSSPIVRLNRAIAVAELDGPEVALAEVEGLPLEGYHPFHATRAELLRRLGRSQEARAAYDRAIGLAGNTAETAYLIRRRDQRPGDIDDSSRGS